MTPTGRPLTALPVADEFGRWMASHVTDRLAAALRSQSPM